MASLIDGKGTAETVRKEIKAEVEAMVAANAGHQPGLAVVLVGDRTDSATYVRNKEKAANEVGIRSFTKRVPADISQADLLAEVQAFNADPSVHGILVQLPLPDHLDEEEILNAISIEKDCDGFHPLNIGKLCMKGRDPMAVPCTPKGCIELLERYNVPMKGANAVVLGRSNIVGLPVANLLLKKNATVTICHSGTKDLAGVCSKADILVAAVGRAQMVKKDWVKPGAVVIDVGINSLPDSTRPRGYRLVGDVDFDEVKEVASLITPVPGGVGPMTIAMLLRNCVDLAKRTFATGATAPVKRANDDAPGDLDIKRVRSNEVKALLRDPVDPQARAVVEPILNNIKARGEEAVLEYAVKFGDLKPGEKHIYSKDDLKSAYEKLSKKEQDLLDRTTVRIRKFAEAQKDSIREMSIRIKGGQTGHTIAPVENAGCYAPAGRYPLPSSVLMTCITARIAGCKNVWVASPKPVAIMLAAAYSAGADNFLAVGGAQAIGALAYGAGAVPACDAVVGPGNQFVTAAKSLITGRCAIDMLAGPSECVVLADDSANPAIAAADLIAQAEHDPSALPILVCLSAKFADKVEKEVKSQLKDLPTADTAGKAFANNSYFVVCSTMEEAKEVCNTLAPEHLEVHTENPHIVSRDLKHYGGLFIGEHAAEVLGDYGAGPNHTLPTGGTARFTGGLSVFTFLRVRTWLQINDEAASQEIVSDSSELALLEGLHGHSRAALARGSSRRLSDTAAPLPAVYGVERPLAVVGDNETIRFALPKGRMQENIFELMEQAGMKITLSGRVLRPSISVPNVEVKLLKPRNVVEMLHFGTRDVGFCGTDLINELNCNVVDYYDTGMDNVRVVAAAPKWLLENGELPKDRHLLVATEYENLTRKWITEKGLNCSIVRTSGATEVFPPEDADFIVDNTATGSTLKANNLEIFDTLATSSTHLCVSPYALQDPKKKARIDQMVMVLKSVLDAKNRVMVEFNVQKDALNTVLDGLPAMKEPTISQLFSGQGYAVKIAVNRSELFELIPKITGHGGSDLIVTDIKRLIHD